VRNCGNGEGEGGALLPYRTKGKWRITQKDLQLSRASPYAPEWKEQENKPHPKPHPSLPKGKEHHTTTSNTVGRNSRPLGRAWGGAYTSSSNSDGVAIPQPRVAGEARYPGYTPPLI